jgi:hypothetical protein
MKFRAIYSSLPKQRIRLVSYCIKRTVELLLKILAHRTDGLTSAAPSWTGPVRGPCSRCAAGNPMLLHYLCCLQFKKRCKTVTERFVLQANNNATQLSECYVADELIMRHNITKGVMSGNQQKNNGANVTT